MENRKESQPIQELKVVSEGDANGRASRLKWGRGFYKIDGEASLGERKVFSAYGSKALHHPAISLPVPVRPGIA